MKITKLLLAAISVFMVLLSGCGTSGNSNSANANIASNANQSKFKRDVKPADVTVTEEEMSNDFSRLSFSERENKYENKTVAVTGKIWKIDRKNRGRYLGQFTFNKLHLHPSRPENLYQGKPTEVGAINCEFQDSDAEQMESLRAGDTVMIQGLHKKDDSSRKSLKNCVVVEIK
jgi:hypothetical protein